MSFSASLIFYLVASVNTYASAFAVERLAVYSPFMPDRAGASTLIRQTLENGQACTTLHSQISANSFIYGRTGHLTRHVANASSQKKSEVPSEYLVDFKIISRPRDYLKPILQVKRTQTDFRAYDYL